MHKILFICHGNICRSTMAQFVFADLVKRRHIDHLFIIDSAATSRSLSASRRVSGGSPRARRIRFQT